MPPADAMRPRLRLSLPLHPMSDLPPPEPLYLPCEPDPAFMTLHLPSPGAALGTGVLICPPFGWDEVCSYRSLRAWACRLATEGYATLRLSLPGTGDSGGDPRAEGLVDGWVGSVAAAAEWLRDCVHGGRIAAIGIGLGGLLSSVAAAGGAPIDDLVLWSTPVRGRTLVRQVRAFGRLERSLFSDGKTAPPAPAPLDGRIEAGGFLLSAQTAAALETVDLAKLDLPLRPRRRALLLQVSGTADAGPALRDRLAQIGVVVDTASGDGLDDMTAHPQGAKAPQAVLDRVSRWLGDEPAPAPPTSRPVSPTTAAAGPSTTIRVGDVDQAVRETAITVPQPFGRLAGVLTEPVQTARADVCVVLLNAGAMRRIGPNRMWVEAARRWASLGIPVLRVDVKGIGDADGDGSYSDDSELYAPPFVPQVLDTLDYLQQRGLGRRFVVGGLCSGAYWAFHAALRDTRISDLLLLNPRALIWTPALGPRRDLRALFSEVPTLAKLRRNVTGPRVRAVLYWLAGTPAELLRRIRERDTSAVQVARRLDASVDSLLATGSRLMVLFSDREPLRDELARTGTLERIRALENVTLEHVAIRDHTLRPAWAQREAHEALDRAVLRAAGVEAVPGAQPAPPADQRGVAVLDARHSRGTGSG